MRDSWTGRIRQQIGLRLGAIIGLLFIILLLLPDQQQLLARGPMNTGHETVECQSCHKRAAGTTRQQLQANIRYLLQWRQQAVDFGMVDVDNEPCLACHDRPNDRHPVFRFNEPRFAPARQAIKPQFCVSCHQEHRGQRVTIGTITYCQHCHEETRLKNDPITIPHEKLIQTEQWETCLGCHDFHGNHVMETETAVNKVLTASKILEYFAGAPSPYGDNTYYQAQQEGR